MRHTSYLFGILLLFLSPLSGKLEQMDASKQIDPQMWQNRHGSQTPQMRGMSPLGGKRFEITEWQRKYSSLGQQRAAVSTTDRFATEVLPKTVVERETLPRSISRMNRQQARIHNWERRREPSLVSKYSNAPVGRLETRQQVVEDMLSQLSLQDINRYQFRSSHSHEGGLPVQSVSGSSSTLPQSSQIRSFEERTSTFFSSSHTVEGPGAKSLPAALTGAQSRQKNSGTSDTSPAPLATAPRVETGEVFIKVRVVD